MTVCSKTNSIKINLSLQNWFIIFFLRFLFFFVSFFLNEMSLCVFGKDASFRCFEENQKKTLKVLQRM